MEKPEKDIKNGSVETHHCMWCGGHGHVKHWIVKIIILLVVFWLGMKTGELKMLLRQGFYGQIYPGQYMMWGNGNNPDSNYGYPGMMGGWGMMNGWRWGYGNQATTTQR